jgi:hypothetical protein
MQLGKLCFATEPSHSAPHPLQVPTNRQTFVQTDVLKPLTELLAGGDVATQEAIAAIYGALATDAAALPVSLAVACFFKMPHFFLIFDSSFFPAAVDSRQTSLAGTVAIIVVG